MNEHPRPVPKLLRRTLALVLFLAVGSFTGCCALLFSGELNETQHMWESLLALSFLVFATIAAPLVWGIRWRHNLPVAIGVPITVIGAVVGFIAYGQATGPIPRLIEEGRAIVLELQEQEREAGVYPTDLPITSTSELSDRFGGWEYRAYKGHFVLRIGDYSRDGFIIAHDEREEDGWYVDT